MSDEVRLNIFSPLILSQYIQIYEVDIPKELDFGVIQEKLRKRGEEMKVAVDLQHRGIFRAINQI